MALTAATYIDSFKTLFPLWETFCDLSDMDELTSPPEAATNFSNAVQDAIDEFNLYLDYADADMTKPLKKMLLKIVKKNCFMLRHCGEEFEKEPQIVTEYKDAIDQIRKGIVGTGNVSITAKDRIMDEGFADSEDLWYE
jgi:phage gp36-like protein